MLGLRLRVHDVLPGLAALKPRRIRQMTTDEGRELLCNIQGPIAARLIAISQARFAAGGSTNIISIFRRSSRPFCRSLDSLQEMAGPPPSPCASHSEVSGRLGTRKFDQMRIKICFSPIKPLQILQRPLQSRLRRLWRECSPDKVEKVRQIMWGSGLHSGANHIDHMRAEFPVAFEL